MDVFPQEMDDYIKESIDYSLGLPVSTKTLQLKLQASEEARKQLQGQYFVLHSRLKEKDETIERTKSEASMNAQALKKFIEENQKLAQECSNLLSQCSRWEKECSLYDHDREALMEFGNEADERAKEAEIRVLETENELRRLAEALEFYKRESEMRMVNQTKATEELNFLRQKVNELERIKSQGSPDSHLACSRCSSEMAGNHNPQPYILGDAFGANVEGQLLDSVIISMINKDEVAANALAFLKENSGVESCQRLLKLWESCSLRPSTQNVLALAAEIKLLQNDKEHLRINLTRAEEEVKVLFDENTILDEENKRLLRQYNRERNHQGSGGKHSSSASAKGSKRKSSPRRSSSVERIIDFGQDSPRQPLSPLQYNSPDSRMHKK